MNDSCNVIIAEVMFVHIWELAFVEITSFTGKSDVELFLASLRFKRLAHFRKNYNIPVQNVRKLLISSRILITSVCESLDMKSNFNRCFLPNPSFTFLFY